MLKFSIIPIFIKCKTLKAVNPHEKNCQDIPFILKIALKNQTGKAMLFLWISIWNIIKFFTM